MQVHYVQRFCAHTHTHIYIHNICIYDHSASRSKPPARKACVCLGLSVCLSVCLGRAGHTDEVTHDVNNTVSPELHNRRRERLPPKPYGQSRARYQFLFIFQKKSKNYQTHTIFQLCGRILHRSLCTVIVISCYANSTLRQIRALCTGCSESVTLRTTVCLLVKG